MSELSAPSHTYAAAQIAASTPVQHSQQQSDRADPANHYPDNVPEAEVPDLQPEPDPQPRDRHHHHTHRVDCYGQRDQRQTPSPVYALQETYPLTRRVIGLSDKRAPRAS